MASSLRGLAFPKRMNWDAWLDDGKGTFPFGRPIRWLVALLDGAVVPLTVYAAEAGRRGAPVVETGDLTHGHRFLPRGRAGASIRVGSFAALRAGLADHCVLVEPAERYARIQEQLRAGGAAPAEDFGLLEEWK